MQVVRENIIPDIRYRLTWYQAFTDLDQSVFIEDDGFTISYVVIVSSLSLQMKYFIFISQRLFLKSNSFLADTIFIQ